MALVFPPITGIVGDQGRGKSFSALMCAAQYADLVEYDLCFNFEIDLKAFWYYCRSMGYTWLMHRILHNKIRYKVSDDLTSFMDRTKTIYVLDEAGVYLNSRMFKDIDPEFLHALAQGRHNSAHLWWIAQFYEQSDRMLRLLSSAFLYCDSQYTYSKQLTNYAIYWKRIYLFTSRNFRIFNTKVLDKYTGLKYIVNARRLSDFHWEGKLDDFDLMLFDCYKSFDYMVGDSHKTCTGIFSTGKHINVTQDDFISYADTEKLTSKHLNKSVQTYQKTVDPF